MTAADDNLKFAVPLADGPVVEAVYYASGTLCVSSQAGCAVGCPFCASGSRGLRRNLSAGEMARQLDAAAERGIAPARVTVSGIGEPLHNPEEVRSFLDLCRGRGLPASLTTTGASLSTLRSFLGLPHNGLMLSLHAGTADVHRRLVPRGPDFEGVWTLLAGTLPALSRRRRRKVGINYLLLAGENDGDEELAALARRLRPYPELTVHLLTCNPVPGSTFTSPPPERVAAAATFLAGEGINTRLPNRWRTRLEGGCGTLFVRGL